MRRLGAYVLPLGLGAVLGLVLTVVGHDVVAYAQTGVSTWSFFDNLTGQYVSVSSCPPSVPGPAGPAGADGAPGAPGIPGLAGPPGASAPAVAHYRQTLLPHTVAPLTLQLALTGVAGKFPVFDGGSVFADPGGNGKLTVLTGDDAACTVNPHELVTYIVSAMGGGLSYMRDDSTVGQFLCLKILPVSATMTVNGSVIWHVE